VLSLRRSRWISDLNFTECAGRRHFGRWRGAGSRRCLRRPCGWVVGVYASHRSVL